MRKMNFHIEDNGDKLTVGQKIGVKEAYALCGYSYLLDDMLGMSAPYPVSERLKSSVGTVLEITNDGKMNIAVIGFDED